MLSLGLVLAFSASAMAVDVKFSGSFYAAGMYQDKTTFRSDYEGPSWYAPYGGINSLPGIHNYPGNMGVYSDYGSYPHAAGGSVGPSTAFYYQRLRLQTDFIVSPGLKLVTRFDALERIWGGARGNASDPDGFLTGPFTNNTRDSQSAGTMSESQNIAFDLAYVSYTSPIGLFEVGYQPDDSWGTVFGNSAVNGQPIGKISYTVPIGPVYINATVSKKVDNSWSAVNASTHNGATDQDQDTYSIGAIYVPNKDIQIGLLAGYKRIASGRADLNQYQYYLPTTYKAGAYGLTPYTKLKFGPVSVEAELSYAWGKVTLEDSNLQAFGTAAGGSSQYDLAAPGYEIAVRNLTFYLNGGVDLGMFYGNATFAYVSGDDPDTKISKMEGGFIDGGVDYNPCLLMFNSDRAYWAGAIPGYGYANSGYFIGSLGPAPMDGVMKNAWLYQGKVGVRPIPALDIMGSVTYAKADKVDMTQTQSKAYGWEVDVTGTYKLTNNLSYMLGGAYLFTGDYYAGYSGQTPENNFLLINKLTLTF